MVHNSSRWRRRPALRPWRWQWARWITRGWRCRTAGSCRADGRRSPTSPSWRRRSSPTSGLSCGSCWWAAGASGTARTAAPGPRPSRGRGRRVERLGGEHHSSHSYISACGIMHDLSLPFLTIPYLSLPYWALFCICALTYWDAFAAAKITVLCPASARPRPQ